MEKLSVKEYLELFGLELKIVGNTAYSWNEADYEWGIEDESTSMYGVCEKCPASALKDTKFAGKWIGHYIPDDSYFNMFNDLADLAYRIRDDYSIPNDLYQILDSSDAKSWPDLLEKRGYIEAARIVAPYCNPLKDNYQFKPMTDEEIDNCKIKKIPIYRIYDIEWESNKYDIDNIELPVGILWSQSDVYKYLEENFPEDKSNGFKDEIIGYIKASELDETKSFEDIFHEKYKDSQEEIER